VDSKAYRSSSQEDSNRIDLLARDLGGIHVLSNSFQAILAVVLRSLEAPVIFMRTKALKALSQIVGSDQSVLNAPNVRSAIDSRLLDNSPAVRDAAVELIGKYVLEYSDVAESYWEKIADRIAVSLDQLACSMFLNPMIHRTRP
jgi:cohesin loading factor subunit SCC2